MKKALMAILVLACSATARAEVVNIDASVNGSPFAGYPQVTVPVTQGHYRATLVNPATTNGALHTAWSYAYGGSGTWRTQYRIRFGDGSLLVGGATPGSDDPQAAFDATPDKTLEFDVPSDQNLEFHVIDNDCDDNVGGVSLDLQALPSCVTAPAGITHWYPGDSDGRDLAGSSPGTVQPGVTAGVAGNVAGAFQFDGATGGVNLGNLPECDFEPNSSFTIEAWINSFGPTAQDTQFVLTLNYHESPTVQYIAIGNPELFVAFHVRDANATDSGVGSPSALTANTFHHVVAVREVTDAGKSLKLYVDGVMVNSAPDLTTGALALAADDFIGRRHPWADNSTFNGLIDELRIYNRALSDCEIAALHKAGSAGACKTGPGSEADLAVTTVPSADPVTRGEDLTYAVRVTNDGPDPATSVTLTDQLPAIATFVSASTGCAENGGVVTCDLGTLHAGTHADVTIVVSPDEAGQLTNRATVSAPTADLHCADDEALTTSTAIAPGTHDLAIVRLVAPSIVNLTATYPARTKRVKVRIMNRGPHDETITSLEGLVTVALENLKSGCAPPAAVLIEGLPNVLPRTLKPGDKLNVFFNVTFNADCVPDPLEGLGTKTSAIPPRSTPRRSTGAPTRFRPTTYARAAQAETIEAVARRIRERASSAGT